MVLVFDEEWVGESVGMPPIGDVFKANLKTQTLGGYGEVVIKPKIDGDVAKAYGFNGLGANRFARAGV